ncbi:NAD(P)/FAD-dependent oxidoreductase [Nonomuraea dietziae]|uniref:FAD-dependent oxidoreductase n=1 Tax=Nonomuraea dietziae TaxID=65515 RepID=UPI0031D752B5
MEVTIVGAGLVGCLLACYLSRRGHEVTLYERRPDPRTAGAERGRSINLAISERGIDALRRLGLAEEVLAEALPMPGRMMHATDGALTFQPYSADGSHAINSISRAALNRKLLDAAEAHPNVTARFGHRLAGIGNGTLEFETDGGPVTEKGQQVVIGADGAYSAVRARLQALQGTDFSQEYLDYGYKELTIPPKLGEFAFDPGALHIWPRGRSMMIALPNPDRSFTCTLFWPHEALAGLDTPERVRAHFTQEYPDAAEVMPHLASDYARNPVGHLVTMRCDPWHGEVGGMLIGLVGDAAHAIVPFYGQGANCGFQDCVELDRCLEETGDDFAGALEAVPAAQGRHRRHRQARAGQFRGDARQGGLQGVPRAEEDRARAGADAARALRLPLRAGLLHHHPVRRGGAADRPPAAVGGDVRGRAADRRGGHLEEMAISHDLDRGWRA